MQGKFMGMFNNSTLIKSFKIVTNLLIERQFDGIAYFFIFKFYQTRG